MDKQGIGIGLGDEEGINAANLRYLSQFQNPHLNKLLSTLASDVPLDPLRIRESLPTIPSPSTPEIDKHPVKMRRLSGPEPGPMRPIRSISTDPEALAPSSPDKITSLPTAHLESLFSPSVFQSPAPYQTPKHFTFDTNHMNQRRHTIATFQDDSSLYGEGTGTGTAVSVSTPRYDDKELFAVLYDVAHLDSPKNLPEPDDLSDWFTTNNSFSSNRGRNPFPPPPHNSTSSYSPRNSQFSSANRFQSSQQGVASLPEYSIGHSRSSPEAVDPTVVSSAYPLPSIPKLPLVTPALSIVDLDNVLKSYQQPPNNSSPSLPFYTSDIPSGVDYNHLFNQDLPKLPPLPVIPYAPVPIPLLIPFSLTSSPTISHETEQIEHDSDDNQLNKDGGRKGMYSLCQQVLQYIEATRTIRFLSEEESIIDLMVVGQVLEIKGRARKLKELFKIFEAFCLASRISRQPKFKWHGVRNMKSLLGTIQAQETTTPSYRRDCFDLIRGGFDMTQRLSAGSIGKRILAHFLAGKQSLHHVQLFHEIKSEFFGLPNLDISDDSSIQRMIGDEMSVLRALELVKMGTSSPIPTNETSLHQQSQSLGQSQSNLSYIYYWNGPSIEEVRKLFLATSTSQSQSSQPLGRHDETMEEDIFQTRKFLKSTQKKRKKRGVP